MSKAQNATKKPGAFAGMADMMNMGGIGSIVAAANAGAAVYSLIDLADIKILPQQRDPNEMESEEQTLDELANNIKALGVLQPIIVCENEDGPEPYRLICGERRVISTGRAELATIPAMVYGKLTQAQIERIQHAENAFRLNLSHINDARVLQAKIAELGSIEAVVEEFGKSRSWISKRLSLLELPPQTARLVSEGITADIEVINTLKTIEKKDPEVARETVNELKDQAGKKGVSARETANKGKDKVKPPTKEKGKPKTPPSNPENVATPPDLSHQVNGPVKDVPPATLADDPALQELQRTFAAGADELGNDDSAGDDLPPDAEEEADEQERFDSSKSPALPPVEVLGNAYTNIFEFGADPKTLLSTMAEAEREGVENWLHAFYDAGVDCKNLALAVIQGFRTGNFSNEGHGAFALVAFLSGGEDGVKFNLLNILGSVKA
ncbi:ParB/RepB/Spo0J family partition protein [Pseudomonas peli]|uniref:ParB/RepB/Spo0J family partition protein n=2 Tax=Pseudomonas peli TaxID=592361 RepID=A0AB37ZE32_9PSED|nr:ParB/RepB/Spo0J family partition protein [Pseudomonas peli]